METHILSIALQIIERFQKFFSNALKSKFVINKTIVKDAIISQIIATPRCEKYISFQNSHRSKTLEQHTRCAINQSISQSIKGLDV